MITYLPGLYEGPEFEIVNDSVDWQQVEHTPRKECFMALKPNLTYQYDGQKFTYKSIYFNALVESIRRDLNQRFNTNYNVCFLNYYENERQHLGWHADDSKGMNLNHPIAVVSYGAERFIYWKSKDQKGELPDYQKVLLEDGSLFVMPSYFQRFFLHKIPKHSEPCGPRISLTFRNYKEDKSIKV